jgi:pSer/pThr/pTyr-binding forkhead associated (FHA) protein
MSLALLEIYPNRGVSLLLDDNVVIGRGDGCDVRVDDPTLSRRHARVVGGDTGTGIEDLGSSNGVYVNGRAQAGIVPLHPGDVLQLGGTVWKVLEGAAPGITGEARASRIESHTRG